MTNETTAMPAAGKGSRWVNTITSLAVGVGFFALWFWLLPHWLGFHVAAASEASWRWLGAAPSVVGFAVALRCVWDFGWTGRGTPAPIAPPRRLVVVGMYRYVRNPMYLGFAAGWIGLWVVFGHTRVALAAAVAAAALGVHLFVIFYEEPTLRKKFGAEYEEYCRNVRRWWPRVHVSEASEA
jgi:protein-S-isoprenylcysteine O-methyltransferase Ste14